MRPQFVTLVVVLLLVLSGCAGPDQPAWLSLNPNQWSNRSDVDEPIVLDVAGPVALDVQTFNGDVIIESDPKFKQAQITIVREGVHGSGRTDEAEQSLASIESSAHIAPGELGQVVVVRTSTSDAEPHFQRAHVFVQMPDVDGVTVRTTNGKVYARHVRGRIDISTSEDDVRVITNQPMTQAVSIVNRNGDIDYRVRGESSGRIDAQTINGRVSHVVRYATMSIEPPTRDDLLRGTFNGGSNPITLRTVNGDIRIAVVHNPEHVGNRIVN